MKFDEAVSLVKDKLPEKRYNHSLRVAETAVKFSPMMKALGVEKYE